MRMISARGVWPANVPVGAPNWARVGVVCVGEPPPPQPVADATARARTRAPVSGPLRRTPSGAGLGGLHEEAARPVLELLEIGRCPVAVAATVDVLEAGLPEEQGERGLVVEPLVRRPAQFAP